MIITLDDLIAGASPASHAEAVSLMGQIAAAQIRITAALADLSTSSTEDRLLNVDEAAAKLGESPQWLYRRTKTLPFAVRQGRHVRYSQSGIERYIARRGR